MRINGNIGFSGHPMIDHFRFLKENVHVTPKMTIPSPSVLHFRDGHKAVSETIYPDMAEFFRDLGLAYQKAVHAFADAGCRYLQLDETNLHTCAIRNNAICCTPGVRSSQTPPRLRRHDQHRHRSPSRRHAHHYASLSRNSRSSFIAPAVTNPWPMCSSIGST